MHYKFKETSQTRSQKRMDRCQQNGIVRTSEKPFLIKATRKLAKMIRINFFRISKINQRCGAKQGAFIHEKQLSTTKNCKLCGVLTCLSLIPHPLASSALKNKTLAMETSSLGATAGKLNRAETLSRPHFQKIVIVQPVWWFPGRPICKDVSLTQSSPCTKSLFPRVDCQR